MKVRFLKLLVFAILFTTQTYAQTIQLSDLFKIHSFNRDRISDFLISKGFSFRDIQNHSNSDQTTWYVNNSSRIYRSVAITYATNDNMRNADYSTYSQAEYVSFKKQIKDRGYIYHSSQNVGPNESNTGASYYYYTNSREPEYYITVRQSFLRETNETMYMIRVNH